MRKKTYTYSLFDLFAVAVACIVIAFISTTILAVVMKGIPSLKEAFYSEEIRFSIKLSLCTSGVSTIICMALAIPTAYALTRTSFPFKKLFQTIIELPLSMPYLVLGLGLLLIFSSDLGKTLKTLGFKVIFDKKGIVMAQIVVNIPYAVRLIRTAFQDVDEKLEYIAGSLGATKWIRFKTIILPLSKNAIISSIILIWSRGLGEFGATLMLVGATRMKTETLPASVYLNMATGDIEAAMASAILILMISFASIFITSWLSIKNKQISRMKDMNV